MFLIIVIIITIIIIIIMTIHLHFLPPARKGSHVKSDYACDEEIYLRYIIYIL